MDDMPSNVMLLSLRLQKEGYDVLQAGDGITTLEILQHEPVDIILLDVMMPGMDGYETCRRILADPKTRHIPVIMITALDDADAVQKGLEAGAVEFLRKPVNGYELMARVRNLLRLKRMQDRLRKQKENLESIVEARTLELREAYRDTVFRLTQAAEFKDEDTGLHVCRISHYVQLLAEKIGVDKDTIQIYFYASPMHDIGKLRVKDSILAKPSALTDEEFDVMREHTVAGARILRGSASPILRSAEKFAMHHHERWDGSGYPQGLMGEAIPIEGRIMNLADQYDALRSRRPYKPPFTHEKVVDILLKGDGRSEPEHFDPEVLNVFRNTHLDFKEIFMTDSNLHKPKNPEKSMKA